VSESTDISSSPGPLYDVRPAGVALGTLAGAIGGFGVTAVVLLSQVSPNSFCEDNRHLRAQFGKHCVELAERFSDRAAVGFILVVFGCTVAAIELIGVGAERASSARSMAISIYARTGFVVSLAVAFWGLSVIAALAFGQETVEIGRWANIGWDLAVPSMLGFVYVEFETTMHGTQATQGAAVVPEGAAVVPQGTTVPLRHFFSIAGLGFVVLAVGILVRILHGSLLVVSANGYVNAVFGFGIVLVLASMVGVLNYGRHPPTNGVAGWEARIVITVCCIFLALLSQLLPV
jgi:hypothetical protein